MRRSEVLHALIDILPRTRPSQFIEISLNVITNHIEIPRCRAASPFARSCHVIVVTKGLFRITTVQVHCGGARSAAGSFRWPMQEIRRSREATRPSTPFLPTFPCCACGISSLSWSSFRDQGPSLRTPHGSLVYAARVAHETSRKISARTSKHGALTWSTVRMDT
jgi:hypothetical protein